MATCRSCQKEIEPVKHQCKNCGRCTKCYNCTSQRCAKYPISKMYADASYTLNSLPRALGVEWEISHIPEGFGRKLQMATIYTNPTTFQQNYDISIHRDGSVTPSGFEAVTEPKIGRLFHDLMTKAHKVFEETPGLKCNESTGYHVHVDASNESNQTFRNFMYFYLKMEDEIYRRLCRKDRIHNECCVPLSVYTRKYFNYTDLLSSSISNAGFFRMILSIYGIDTEADNYELLLSNSRFKRLKDNRRAFGFERHNNPRYSGMNIHALYHMGTLEWRMKEGTIDPIESMGWPLFCGWFTHLGLSLPIKTLVATNTIEEFLALPQVPKRVVKFTEQMLAMVEDKNKPAKKSLPELEEFETEVLRDDPIPELLPGQEPRVPAANPRGTVTFNRGGVMTGRIDVGQLDTGVVTRNNRIGDWAFPVQTRPATTEPNGLGDPQPQMDWLTEVRRAQERLRDAQNQATPPPPPIQTVRPTFAEWAQQERQRNRIARANNQERERT